jgi:hypothetical protein
MQNSISNSNTVYDNIQNLPELHEKVIFSSKKRDNFNFRLMFKKPDGCKYSIYGMSFSFVPDTECNEIALLGKFTENSDISKSRIIYDDNCGYSDVRYFEDHDIQGLVNEIIRIWNYLSSSLYEEPY